MLAELMSAGTSIFNAMAARDAQNDAQAFNSHMYQNRYQMTVEDMKKAGLNPMLAYTQGPGASPTSGAVTSSAADLGDVHNKAVQADAAKTVASAQAANLQADTENKDAQGKLYEAQAAAQWASAAQSQVMVDQVKATVDKVRAETEKTKAETANLPFEQKRLYEAAKALYEQAQLLSQQGKSETFRQRVLQATAAKLQAEGLIAQADYKAIVDTGGIGRIAREVKPVSDIGADWLSPSKLIDKLLPNASRSKSSTTRETGTTYDRNGRESGGYSRERTITEE